MVDLLLLYLEMYMLIYVSVQQWQRYGAIRYALLAASLSVLAFILLWALISPLARLLYPLEKQALLVGPDTLGVVLTTAAHLTFVRFYFFATSRRQSSPLQN
ncbi:MAG: hypothetical protein RML15_05015 [Bacteroidota bacterium]|nr:hypothetical protein [Candidatus Kapabacteria bacterium]MDW8271753.1 hypothetical protein [Bacteroidota bacterium]